MIILRRYEYFWRLIEKDERIMAAYKEACAYKADEATYEKYYQDNLWNRAYGLDEHGSILNPKIIWDCLEKLDEIEPYDNGFNWGQVNGIKVLDYNDNPDDFPFIDIAYIYKDFDGIEHIVAVEHKE